MFKDLVGLVTGGASGMGRATAELLLERGARVVIVDLPSSPGVEVAKQLGKNAIFAPADVTSENDMKAVVQCVKDSFGKLDVVVHCAGILSAGLVYDFEADEPGDLASFKKIVEVNLVGTFNVVRLTAGLLGKNTPDAEGQRGVIITTASITAFDGKIGVAAYSASKAGVVGLTQPFACEFAKQGIRVVTIAPGMFTTGMSENVSEEQKKGKEKAEAQLLFPKRFGQARDFAQMVEAILRTPYLNGQTIRLDGCVHLRP